MKIPTKEEIEGKTQKQIEALLKKSYPEIKAIREALQAALKSK